MLTLKEAQPLKFPGAFKSLGAALLEWGRMSGSVSPECDLLGGPNHDELKPLHSRHSSRSRD